MDTQQQKQFKILVIGDSCVDIYHYGECTRISPEAPVPIFKHEKSEKYGGMASNRLREYC
jgi:bifunctional ADP-heptose synthase (sugar kinase/adenylyltransferase)